MSTQHIRNAIAILLILTLANIGASFATLYAVHEFRDLEHVVTLSQEAS